jgi:hypothetical protein
VADLGGRPAEDQQVGLAAEERPQLGTVVAAAEEGEAAHAVQRDPLRVAGVVDLERALVEDEAVLTAAVRDEDQRRRRPAEGREDRQRPATTLAPTAAGPRRIQAGDGCRRATSMRSSLVSR